MIISKTLFVEKAPERPYLTIDCIKCYTIILKVDYGSKLVGGAGSDLDFCDVE